jgi:ABC-type transport system involved in multi-copper enzyme maturation permease subunit
MLGITDYFWRLIPANPILLRVVENGGKRRRDLIIRCAYLGLLIVLVLISLYNTSSNVTTASLAELAKTSATVFQNLSYLQLGLVALLAPIFTAGAITQEKDSQTYDILLATPLSNGQIVLGSLLSRLFFVVALLISGIPIFSITQIFGGVAINNIIVSFLIAAATAFVTGALAMAIATFKVGTRRTIFSFYLFIVIYLFGLALIDRLGWTHPIIGHEPNPLDPTHPKAIVALTSWITGIHPFLALRTLFNDTTYLPPDFGDLPPSLQRWPIGWYLSSPASFFITFMFVLSFVLVMPSIILLRWMAQTNMPFKTWILTKVKLSTGDRTRKPRSVWNNPIAWREAKTKASAAKASVLRYGFIAAGIFGALWLAWGFSHVIEPPQYIQSDSYNATTGTLNVYDQYNAHRYVMTPKTTVRIRNANSDTEGHDGTLDDLHHRFAVVSLDANDNNSLATVTLMPFTRQITEDSVRNYLLGAVVLEFAVILLIVTNAAASTVTREKEDGTLDLLLTTPITSRYYIWGKLRGLVYFVLPLIAVPVGSVFIFVIEDAIRFTGDSADARWIAFPEAVIILPCILVIVAAFAAILGMQMSLRCRTSVMAVMSSVGIVVGICGLFGWCGYSFLDSSRQANGPALVLGSFSPFTVMTMLINPYQFAEGNFSNAGDMAANRLTIFISSVVAVAAYTSIVWAMYKSMVKNFDMTIRRQQR